MPTWNCRPRQPKLRTIPRTSLNKVTDVALPSGPAFARPQRFAALAAGLGALSVVALVAGVSFGAVSVSPLLAWRVVGSHVGLGSAPADLDPVMNQIVWDIRVPRALLGYVVGAGLAVAGTTIQAVVRNPLGDPYVLGIVPGASLGAVIVIATGALGGVPLHAAAFAGALVAFAATFALGRQGRRWPPTRLVLAGVAVGYLCSAATFFLQIRAAPNQVQRVLFWSLGSVSSANWTQLRWPTLTVIGCSLWLVAHGRRLDALVLGDHAAGGLGIDVGRFQVQLMAVSSLLAAVVVTVAGGIGFVGLVVPHVARLLAGTGHRRAFVASALIGGTFVVTVDVVARMAQRPTELPLGIVTAAVGAPCFLWLLRRGPAVAE